MKITIKEKRIRKEKRLKRNKKKLQKRIRKE